jgi:hypothetical protein
MTSSYKPDIPKTKKLKNYYESSLEKIAKSYNLSKTYLSTQFSRKVDDYLHRDMFNKKKIGMTLYEQYNRALRAIKNYYERTYR